MSATPWVFDIDVDEEISQFIVRGKERSRRGGEIAAQEQEHSKVTTGKQQTQANKCLIGVTSTHTNSSNSVELGDIIGRNRTPRLAS